MRRSGEGRRGWKREREPENPANSDVGCKAREPAIVGSHLGSIKEVGGGEMVKVGPTARYELVG